MAQLIISVSGLRGIVGETLTPPVAGDYVAAFAAGLSPGGSVVVTRDGRASGPLLARAIAAVLQASGLNVLDADVAATPTTGVLVRQHAAVAGVQISASHNPAPYNGLKLFGPDGRVLTAAAGEAILRRYQIRQTRWVDTTAIGDWRKLDDTTSAHLEKVLATVDATAIRRRKFRVVLDSNHGAGALLGIRLLESLHCEVNVLGSKPDGQFEHPPEPTAENLQSVAEGAANFQADVVFCQDPDADRLAVLDKSGRYIGEELTLALLLEHHLSRCSPPGIVVTNCSTSRMAADIAARHGFAVKLSAVGEANVTELMIQTRALYGGEGNGGPIDPRVGFVRDSFVGMAQILDMLAARNQSISELVGDLPRYEICKTTIPLDRDQVPDFLERLKKEFPTAATSSLDGLRLDWDDRWLLVRASNTEPIIRAVAEAKSMPIARELCDRTRRLAQPS